MAGQKALVRLVQYMQQQRPQSPSESVTAESNIKPSHMPNTPLAATAQLDTYTLDALPVLLPQFQADALSMVAAVEHVAAALLVEDEISVLQAFVSFLFANAGLWAQGIVRSVCCFLADCLTICCERRLVIC